MIDRRHLLNIFFIAAASFALHSPATAQQRDDFIRPFFGFYGSQSLETAIGSATVASGQVIPGYTSNPANIGMNRFGHLQLDFQSNHFDGPNASSNSTVPGGVYAILPVPVYQGSLAFSAGIQKVVDFSGAYKTGIKEGDEIGGIYATELGVAWEVAPDFMIGTSSRYLKGSDELSITLPDTNSLLNPTYKGYYFTFGVLNRTAPNVLIGASVDLPASVKVHDKVSEWPVANPQSTTTDIWNYTLTRPLNFHLGFSLLYPLWSGFYELEWGDWAGLEFSSDQYSLGDKANINREISGGFRSTLTHHFGAALHLPWLPLHLYAGYQYLPVPFTSDYPVPITGFYKDDLRQSLSVGASYLLNQQFSLHGSVSNYFWSYQKSGGGDRDESNRMAVFGATLHF